MHIVVIPNTFPNKDHTYRGIFFHRQAEAISKKGIKTGMVVPDIRGAREMKNWRTLSSLGRINNIQHENMKILAQTGINFLPGSHQYLKYIYPNITKKIFEKYIRTEGKPDLIHAHVALYAGYAAMRLSKEFNIPYIVTEHSSGFERGLYSNEKLKIAKEVYDNASAVVVVGERLKSVINKLNIKKGIDVIPNLVDTEVFTISEEVRNKNLLFSLGNLVPNKGFDSLLKAFARASEKNKALRLRIGGQGPLLSELQQLAYKLQIKDKVEFLGKLNQQQVVKELHNCGAFILTSRIETFGIVFLEAMAAGVPVIATKSGGPQDFVRQSTGVLCEVDNIEEICEAILYINSKYSNYRPEAIRNYIMQNYSSEVIANKIITLYKNTLNS